MRPFDEQEMASGAPAAAVGHSAMVAVAPLAMAEIELATALTFDVAASLESDATVVVVVAAVVVE